MPVSNLSQPYILARLHKGKSKGKDRWCIKFYQTNPSTKKRQRFMPTFDMNRIKTKKARLKFAQEKVKEVNKLLPYGYPFEEVTLREVERMEAEQKKKEENHNPLHDTNIVDAILISAKFRKAKTNNKKSKQMHDSRAKLFIDYLKAKKLTKMKIIDFDSRSAKRYLNYLMLEKNLRNTTYNNTLAQIKRHFKELKANEYIISNPFDNKEKLPDSPKMRRDFAPEERRVIAKYLYENNRRLYYAVLFIYYGFIRPGALRDMKFSWIKVEEGIIQLPFDGNKSGRWKYVTIPKAIRAEILNNDFVNAPSNYYVFGKNLEPSLQQSGKNTLYNEHRAALEHLLKTGELHDIKGLTFYSWKDTGITELGDYVSLLDLQRQAGHTDPKVTLKYYHNKRVNKGFQKVEKHIIND